LLITHPAVQIAIIIMTKFGPAKFITNSSMADG
jgi:hypothetical protein